MKLPVASANRPVAPAMAAPIEATECSDTAVRAARPYALPRTVPQPLKVRFPAASRDSRLETPTNSSFPMRVSFTRTVFVPTKFPTHIKEVLNEGPGEFIALDVRPGSVLYAAQCCGAVCADERAAACEVAYARKEGGCGTPGGTTGVTVTTQEPSRRCPRACLICAKTSRKSS